ncbi:major allergen I polypeptide chain 1-like [Nycticebus coucang]|uniref:major allergen I polypeptide chain 1-like n=1 Tax=Nycticebus coucang TaxID=9470 RepID=UPI00234D3E52|nr:major allergen I polypeptide chain 1-like [Nycticebus coucang]
MKLATAFLLLCAASLLLSGANCDICPAVEKHANLFLKGNTDEFLNYAKNFVKSSAVLENAKQLKMCSDNKLTEEDKDNVQSGLDKIYSSNFC